MILHAKSRCLSVPQSCNRLIIQVAMGDFQMVWKRFLFDCEPVILSGDFDFAGVEVDDGLIRPAVAKFELEGLGATRECQQLMPQADPKHGLLAHQ